MIDPNQLVQDDMNLGLRQDGVNSNLKENEDINVWEMIFMKGNRHFLFWVIIFLMSNAICFTIYNQKIFNIINKPFIGHIIALSGYLVFLMFFNTVFSYSYLGILNRVHNKFPKEDEAKKKQHKKDSLMAFDFAVYAIWTPSFVLWFMLYLILFQESPWVFVGIIAAYLPYKVGRYFIYQYSSLFYKTLQPKGDIQIDPNSVFK